MKSLLTAFIALTLFISCKEKPTIENQTVIKPIDSLFKDYYTFKKRINPLEATKAGFREYNDQVANYISTPYQKDFLHEAIPGHHYQLSLQQENTNLPEFLHPKGMSVFVEGWALYAESLGKELTCNLIFARCIFWAKGMNKLISWCIH